MVFTAHTAFNRAIDPFTGLFTFLREVKKHVLLGLARSLGPTEIDTLLLLPASSLDVPFLGSGNVVVQAISLNFLGCFNETWRSNGFDSAEDIF